MKPEDIAYFEKGGEQNRRFWDVFGESPTLTGASVLDLGCGHGRLCVDMALKGANRVIGLDTNKRLIEFAVENVKKRYPTMTDRIEFLNLDIRDLPDDGSPFDIIVSKDSLEHVIHLEAVFQEMVRRLRHGGRMYLGFGPLYHSSRGDHRRTEIPFPWGHLLIPESMIIRRLNRKRPLKISSIEDLGLSKWRLNDYRSLFLESGLRVTLLQAVDNDHPLARICALLRKWRAFEPYFTYNLYCLLEKP